MTTINPMSTLGTTAIVLPSDLNDGWTYVASAGHYKTADLLAALNAVPADALAGSEECRLATEKKLAKAEAERDALAKTVEQVREALSRHPEPCTETEFTCGWKGAVVDLRSALDPEPFVLPTEVPARIEARNKDGETVELHLWTDGHNLAWHNQSTEADLFPTAVMAYFTGHRLLDGEA